MNILEVADLLSSGATLFPLFLCGVFRFSLHGMHAFESPGTFLKGVSKRFSLDSYNPDKLLLTLINGKTSE